MRADTFLRGDRFYCARCGAEETVVLPVLLERFVKQGKAFEKKHRDCPVPPQETPREPETV